MSKYKSIGALLILIVCSLMMVQSPARGEEPNKNIVIAAGETWGTYSTPNHAAWPRHPIRTDPTTISMWRMEGSIFYTSRMVTSGLFGNPPWSWMSGKIGMDFTNTCFAVEYNPTDEFATLNAPIVGEDNKHYALLMFTPNVAGADDPNRNFHDPADGGAYLSDDRTHAWASAGWPTTLGVDVKVTVHSWTMPWGHLDDFHLVEVELYNTGEVDIDADGTVDIHNNRINAMNFAYLPGCFHFRIYSSGGRGYYVNNNRYRATVIDLTPDENGAPWDIYFQAIGSPGGTESYPALTNGGEYYDAFNGYGWLGAKKWNPDTQQWEEKFLCFKDANGNEVVPAIGEGTQRGWFHTTQPGWGGVMSSEEFKAHTASMGCFYVDGGKSNDGAAFDLSPNPAIFASGTPGDPTTFVVKDPAEWTYPDGAWEMTPARMAIDPETGKELGMSPMDPNGERGRPIEPGIITEGLVSQYQFDGDPVDAMGPFAMEVGERIRVYFYRGSGFRINGLRKTVKAARAVFESIQPDGSYNVPSGPPVPEIKVSGTTNVRPAVKWQDPGDADGIKIYKAVAWPRYNSTEDLYPRHDTWWKTNDPNVDPGQVEINPLFTRMDLLKDQQGDYWGPYHLVKVIKASDYVAYKNDEDDAGEYPYKWEDDTYTAPGQSYWYYVSSYKENAAATVPAPFQGLDNVSWLESGKVNINGRTGQWENTWPWAWRHAYYPKETDTQGLKDLGAAFVLVSPTTKTSDLEMNRAKIGVRPNPYKRVAFHDASGKHQVMFYNLPQSCTIQVYDLSGMLVDEIDFEAPVSTNGTYFWDMYSKNGNEVASGLYIWVAKYDGGMQQGTFAIIK